MMRNTRFSGWFMCALLCGVGWLCIQMPAAQAASALRVTEYAIAAGQFTGTTYTLSLSNPLLANHIILVRGSASGTADRGPDENYARVTALPAGVNGQLPTTASNNQVRLQRFTANSDWVGGVTVLECVNQCNRAGFRTLDIQTLTTAANATSGSLSSTVPWVDPDQIVPFGGAFGAGSNVLYRNASLGKNNHPSAWLTLKPQGTETITWTRVNGGGAGLKAADHTVYIVEWGSEWATQSTLVSGKKGGTGVNIISEYTTAAVTAFETAKSWLWSTGTSAQEGVGDGSEGVIIGIGDTMALDAVESTVRMGAEVNNIQRDFMVYVMTHPELAVDHRFKASGNSNATTFDQTVDTAPAGTRMAWCTNTAPSSLTNFPRPIFSSRYQANTTVRLQRQRSGTNFAAWIQGIDFSGVGLLSGQLAAGIVDALGTPVANPQAPMTPLTVSFASQQSTGSFGTDDARIRVTNETTNPAWTLVLAAENGATSKWTGLNGNHYDFNDPTANARDGTDGDAWGGQLTIDPSTLTITPQANCATAGITPGSATAFSEGVVGSITLASSNGSGDIGCYYDLRGIGISQSIPAEQPQDTYTLPMVITITAI